MKNYKKAEENAKIVLENAKLMNSRNIQVISLELLIDITRESKNYKKAFKYQSEAIVSRDSLNLVKIKNDLVYSDFQRIHNNNSILEKSNKKISLKNSAYEKGLYIITSLFVVVLILLFLYLRKIRQKNKVNQRLTLKSEEIKTINQTLERVNEELTVQNDVTSKQNAELEQINAVKNKFFSIVSHDLRSPIATLKMLFSTYFDGHLSQEEMNVLLKKLEENIFDTADFLDNLLEWSKSQLEGMMVNPEAFQVEAVLELNLKILQPQISAKGLRIEDSIECSAAVYADRNMINVVIRNILSNSIKFCHKGDAIILRCIDKSNTVLISVQDTGIGMQLDKQEKIFQLEHTISKGTSAEKGHHIGLVLCKDMVEQNGGKIWFESKEGVGTTFFIELPRNEI
jgi:two-component system sensor histidine kinase/response regulator